MTPRTDEPSVPLFGLRRPRSNAPCSSIGKKRAFAFVQLHKDKLEADATTSHLSQQLPQQRNQPPFC